MPIKIPDTLPARTTLEAEGIAVEVALTFMGRIRRCLLADGEDLMSNVNNLLNEKYWDQTNLGEGLNGALAVKVRW